MLEAEVVELLADGLAELRDDFAAFGGKRLPGAPKLGFKLLQLGVDASQLGLALLEVGKLAGGLLAEGDNLGHGRAVLALEGMDEVEALFELLQSCGINVGLVGIAGKLGLQIPQGGHGLFVQGKERRGGGIHALQFLQGAPDDARLGQERGFVLAQQIERGLAELEQPGGVAGAAVVLLHLRFLLRLEPRRGDFLHLKAQQINLLRVGLLIHDQGGLLGFERGAAADEVAKGLAFAVQVPKGVQDGQLPGRDAAATGARAGRGCPPAIRPAPRGCSGSWVSR